MEDGSFGGCRSPTETGYSLFIFIKHKHVADEGLIGSLLMLADKLSHSKLVGSQIELYEERNGNNK